MTKKQKLFILAAAVLVLTFGVTGTAQAMHIMEGYLPAGFCIAWGVICLPFLFAGLRSIQKALAENRRVLPLIAMAGTVERCVPENSFRYRKLFPYDRHRTGRDPFRAGIRQHSGADCPCVPGAASGPRGD